jgi:MFS family permease
MTNNTVSMDQKLENFYFYKPFAATIAGFSVQMVTGTLSACSSGLIIYIISRSQQKLSTTYHRIMAFMSAFDIISSLFIALGTIMMPSDTMYKYAGPLLGNKVTCQIQGWLVVFGIGGGTSLNACLAWYFVCSIAFKMKASRIRKYIEPAMYIYIVIIALFVPSFFLSKDLLNPNSYDTFCTIVAYPESCDEDKWYDWNHCTWSEGDLEDYFRYVNISFVVIGMQFSLIVVGMSIILWTTFRNNREIKSLLVIENTNHRSHNHASPSGRNSTVEEQVPGAQSTDSLRSLKYTRILMLQALMYIGSFMFTWVFTVLSGTFNIASIELDAINSVLFPLQGFWNMLIFLYDKTYLIRQHDKHGRDISFCMAFKQILTSPSHTPTFIVSSISIVNIEPRDEDDPDEPNDIRLPSHMPDIGLSQIGSEYDGLSEVRGQGGDYSVVQDSSSSIDVNSNAVSEVGKVSSLEAAPRTNLLHVRRSVHSQKYCEEYRKTVKVETYR